MFVVDFVVDFVFCFLLLVVCCVLFLVCCWLFVVCGSVCGVLFVAFVVFVVFVVVFRCCCCYPFSFFFSVSQCAVQFHSVFLFRSLLSHSSQFHSLLHRWIWLLQYPWK